MKKSKPLSADIARILRTDGSLPQEGPQRTSGHQAIVQVLGGYKAQGPTNIVVPISVYLPNASAYK